MRPIVFVFAFFLLTACAPQMPTAQAEVASSATPTAVPTATATPTPLPTSTPTASPTPTFTPTPTPVTLPVTNGTPIPDLPYEVITAENVHRLRQIARYGYPRLLDKNPYRLTADGKTIVVGTTLGLEFYDAQTQAKTGGFEVEFLRDFDLTPDGQYLLTLAGEGVLTVWTRDGEKVREFDVEAGDAWALKAVALSPDGKLLAVQRKKADWQETDKVDVYRVADGSLLDTVRGEGAVFSPDGRYLATLFDGLRLYPVAELGQGWEKRLPKQSLPWCGVMEGSCGLVFSPDGTLAAVVRTGQVDVYRVEDRKLVRQVSGWEADQYALPQVQFGVDGGRMVITTPALYDSQGNVRVKAQAILVDIASGEWVSKSDVEEGFAYWDGEQVGTFTWKAEGEMVPYRTKWMHPRMLISNKGEVKLSVVDWWALGWQEPIIFYGCENEKCNSTEFTTQEVSLPGFKFVRQGSFGYVISKVNQIKVPVSDWVFGYLLDEHTLLWSVSYSPSYGKTILIDLESGQQLLQVSYVHPLYFEVVDDEVLMTTSDNKTIVFDLSERALKKHSKINLERNIIVSPIAYSSASSIILWTAFDGKRNNICLFVGDSCTPIIQEDVFAMTFSSNGRLFATYGADGFIRVWAVLPEGANVR